MAEEYDVVALLTDRIENRSALDDHDREALRNMPYSVREFEAGQYLLREGDRGRACSLLLAGSVYRHKIVADGGRQIVSIHIPGDIIDLQNVLLREADHNIQALTATTIALLPHEKFLALSYERPNIGMALWRESLIEASIFREWVANVGRRDARSRTAHMICELAIRREAAGLGSRHSYELPMTQEQLGDTLGLTAVHVNRTLKSLQDDRLIERSKRSVTVTDWDQLARVADFTSTYLHLTQND